MSGWLAHLLDQQQLLVVLGSGGVGKTTLAAALALQAALRGRRTLVLTIDPARRLANALGLAEFSAERQAVPLEGLVSRPGHPPGELWAMMLDVSRAFDGLVARHASSPAAKERILSHRLYRQMVESLAGSHDLAALEQLHELIAEGQWDLIVLDTPPKEHAFDLLDAPGRLVAMVAQSKLRWLLLPMAGLGEVGGGLRHFTPRLILRTLSRFTGVDVLRDLATLTLALLDLGQGLRTRAERVEQLLASPACSFLVVTRPDPLTVAEALGQRRKVRQHRLPFGGYLVNRSQSIPPGAPAVDADLAALADRLAGQPPARGLVEPAALRSLLGRLGEGLRLLRLVAEQEWHTLAPLREAEPDGAPAPLLNIPEFDDEIFSVDQLLRFGQLLLGVDASEFARAGRLAQGDRGRQ